MVSTAIALQGLKDDDVAWKLLRAKRAPVVIAVLDAHFTEDVRRIPVPEFVNLVEVDLDELRARTSIEVTKSAQAYCERWRQDGYLVRRPVAQSRQETYELSSGALTAIDYAKRMLQPHRTATQSRLSIIIDQISSLALASDENEDRHRKALHEERERIDRQLALLDQGRIDLLDRDRAAEKAHDIVSLAREIPSDFVHVRNDFERINRSLYETIINYEDGHQDVLKDVFDGVDEIAQSASGRSFKGFYSLLRDSNLTETVQDDIDAILDSDYASALRPEERRFLRGLVQAFVDQSQEVNGVMTSFAQGLRRFVQSQNYQQERALKRELDRALGRAHRVIEQRPCTCKTGQSLNLTSVSIMPVTRWRLKNPAETKAAAAAHPSAAETLSVSFEELRRMARETEIDFTELVGQVNDCVRSALARAARCGSGRQPSVSIAEVLQAHPASQGLASVVGLVALALDQGEAKEGRETLRWTAEDGRRFRAEAPALSFYEEVKL